MSVANVLQAENTGVLYVVATPIGNLGDISRRAVDVLSAVQMIAAEDTRRTRALLDAIGVSGPELTALHEHNEERAGKGVVAALEAGRDVALVSDAGTPLLSDPGFTLVRACYDRGLAVRPVPGPSALASALSVCPLPTVNFRFIGFLPARATNRRTRLEAAVVDGPTVFFEAPHRMKACLEDLTRLVPQRQVFIGREMTKRFESYLCDLPGVLASQLAERDQYRGEFVCVVEGPAAGSTALVDATARKTMKVLCAALPPGQAARVGAELLGVHRRELYQLAMEFSQG